MAGLSRSCLPAAFARSVAPIALRRLEVGSALRIALTMSKKLPIKIDIVKNRSIM